METYIIREVKGREVLDSRGNPTVEAEVILENGVVERAIVPNGASTGSFEAVSLVDKDKEYHGLGVKKAVERIQRIIGPKLVGMDVRRQKEIDQLMRYLDHTENKSYLGANAILAVSLAVCKAAAKALHLPLYQYIGGIAASYMPIPSMNILNGGAHAGNGLDIQECMIVPVGASSFQEGLRMCAEVYAELKKQLKEKGKSIGLGDEGGFAPETKDIKEALHWILEAIQKAGYEPKKDIALALDVAASEWKGEKVGEYILPKAKKRFTREELLREYEELLKEFPIISLEDPFDEEDIEGWKMITKKYGDKILLIGDDLFVTNPKRLQMGIDEQIANAILIKPNQIGTFSETEECVRLAKKAGYRVMISHRSGDSEDAFLADAAVGLQADYIKSGAPARGERTAKYNELLRIEEALKN